MERGFTNVGYVAAERPGGDGFNAESHAWLVVGGMIVDITADQFGKPSTIVARHSPWHAKEWIAEPPRPPICSQSNWPMYPEGAWQFIVAEMSHY